jgi:hypothetical protein
MSSRSLWYIVTPVYKPAPGGGAIYTDILARALATDGADVVVESEAFPGEPRSEEWSTGRGSIKLNRLYPLRAGRAERDWRSYLAYAAQNLKMLGMPRRLARAMRARDSDKVTVLVHSSLLYNHGVLPFVVRRLRRACPAAILVVDVRDPKFDEALGPVFSQFDAAVGCSEAITAKLRALLPERVRVMTIPIPFERPDALTEAEIAAALAQHGLQDVPYLLNPNGVSEAKRYPEMLEVVRALRAKPGYERARLVTIGRKRDWAKRDDEAVREGLLSYVGVVNNRAALALAGGAQATIILSRVEGMPRSGLETLAIGKPLLAPEIKEFVEAIPSSVVASNNPEEIAEQAIGLLTSQTVERYPLDRHEMTNLVPLYRSLERA